MREREREVRYNKRSENERRSERERRGEREEK